MARDKRTKKIARYNTFRSMFTVFCGMTGFMAGFLWIVVLFSGGLHWSETGAQMSPWLATLIFGVFLAIRLTVFKNKKTSNPNNPFN